jgi:hypothetical protein
MSGNIPEALPTLAAGKHSPGSGQACVMEYVSILAGEQFSDHPSCTDPLLAAAARSVNDYMSDAGRHKLVPLIGRLFGTSAGSSDEVAIKLARFINEYVHAQIDEVSDKDPDDVLVDYLSTVIDKFYELTGLAARDTTDLTNAAVGAARGGGPEHRHRQ